MDRCPRLTRRDPWVGSVEELCRFGARQYADGMTDLLAFNVWFDEVEQVKSIMAERYPDIPYVFGSADSVLNRARMEWAKRNQSDLAKEPDHG